MASLRNIVWQARAVWTLLASIFKREWRMDDYPIRVSFQPITGPLRKSRLKPLPWTASVINWPGMSGSANSKLEALEELRKNFERFKATKLGLPRPGTKVPVEFASNERVSQHSQLAKDFVNRVLDIDWAWVSDKSSLWDFHGDETNKSLTEKIRHIYGVDVSDISAETSQTFSTGFQSIGLFRQRLVNSVAGQMVLCAHLTQPIQTESLKTW